MLAPAEALCAARLQVSRTCSSDCVWTSFSIALTAAASRIPAPCKAAAPASSFAARNCFTEATPVIAFDVSASSFTVNVMLSVGPRQKENRAKDLEGVVFMHDSTVVTAKPPCADEAV